MEVVSAFTSVRFGRRLATDEMALATYLMLPVEVIVLLRQSHARAPGNRFRSPRTAPQNEFKSCHRDQRGWTVAMILFERWRNYFRCGASSALWARGVSGRLPWQSLSLTLWLMDSMARSTSSIWLL